MSVRPGQNDTPLALWQALLVSLLVLACFYYWFGIADRYIIFLYYHEMGPMVPDTSPFSAVTSSRYWMAGLVAGGIILVVNTAVIALFGRLPSIIGQLSQEREPILQSH